MCERLLANPVTEDFEVSPAAPLTAGTASAEAMAAR
jgi:hypothetical protein